MLSGDHFQNLPHQNRTGLMG
uniref:Uncharacterized protein n=1 Tax=Anguilla anguilla TaxID=7936 RepID=A0A0E9VUN6_ANGAN